MNPDDIMGLKELANKYWPAMSTTNNTAFAPQKYLMDDDPENYLMDDDPENYLMDDDPDRTGFVDGAVVWVSRYQDFGTLIGEPLWVDGRWCVRVRYDESSSPRNDDGLLHELDGMTVVPDEA